MTRINSSTEKLLSLVPKVRRDIIPSKTGLDPDLNSEMVSIMKELHSKAKK